MVETRFNEYAREVLVYFLIILFKVLILGFYFVIVALK